MRVMIQKIFAHDRHKHTSSRRSFWQSEVANAKAHAYLIGIACAFNHLCILSRNFLLTNAEESWNMIGLNIINQESNGIDNTKKLDNQRARHFSVSYKKNNNNNNNYHRHHHHQKRAMKGKDEGNQIICTVTS